MVARTFSKAYGLAAQRVGWALAPNDVNGAVTRLRCPFNVNAAALRAAEAAVQDQPYLRKMVATIRKTRNWFAAELHALGFVVVPSQANFLLLAFPEGGDEARSLDAAMQARGILAGPGPTEGTSSESLLAQKRR